MKTTIKVYKFMDNLYLNESVAEIDSTDWNHKESVKTVFVSIDQNELNEIKNLKTLGEQLDSFNWLNLQTFETYEQAKEETETENSL